MKVTCEKTIQITLDDDEAKKLSVILDVIHWPESGKIGEFAQKLSGELASRGIFVCAIHHLKSQRRIILHDC